MRLWAERWNVAEFNRAWGKVLDIEGRGKATQHPADRGGWTKYGISERAHPGVNVRQLTLMQAVAIYREKYWDALGLDAIEDQDVATEIFEQAVNFGVEKAVQHVQYALNALGHATKVDGVLGPITRGIVNAIVTSPRPHRRRALLVALNGEQYLAYKEIVRFDPTQLTFMHGWLRRVDF